MFYKFMTKKPWKSLKIDLNKILNNEKILEKYENNIKSMTNE